MKRAEARDAGEARPFPGALAALGILVALIALECAGEIHLRLLIAVPAWIREGAATADGLPAIVRSLTRLFPLCVMAGVGWKVTRAPAAEVFPLRRPAPSLLLPLLACAVGLSVMLSELDNLMRATVTLPDGYLTIAGATTGDWRDTAWQWLYLLLLKPLVDEMLFRGVMLRGLALRYHPVVAVFIAATCYAVVALNPWLLLGGLARGVLLGWLYLKTRSITPGVLLIGASAAVATVSERLVGPIQGYTSPITQTVSFHPWWLDVGASALLIGGIVGMAWSIRRSQPGPAVL